MSFPSSIYGYIKQEEARFSDEIQVAENWTWNLRNHVQLIFHLINDRFFSGPNDWSRVFKNIMEPLLNLAFWTEDLEVKDVSFSINQRNGRAMSFLVKKYHDDRYVKEHDLDTLFDEITESDLTYGGVVVQKGATRPEVLPLNTVAFCDQTDMLGGPVAFKHYFSPAKLRKMSEFGWGEESNGANTSIEELIELATYEKDVAGTDFERQNKTPGKTIEVYVIRGALPDSYLNDGADEYYVHDQVQIVAFYTDKDKKRQGVTLYRKADSGENIKFFTSKKVIGRALGRGVGESLLHDQVWTNFLTIHKSRMLEAGAKVPLVTDDAEFTNKNRIRDMDTLEITTIAEGKSITQIPTAAVANIQLYEKSINEFFEHAQLMGAAFDPILGKEAASGTTFRGQERTVAQGRGLHDRRRGQRAKFIEEIYRDWIIPDIIKEITKGKKFLSELSSDEFAYIVEAMVENFKNKSKNDLFDKPIDDYLSGKLPLPTEQGVEELAAEFKVQFSKGGNKRLIEILEGEFEDVPIEMNINIAGKQKDLVNLTDKILAIFQFVFANPQGFQQAMQIPSLAKAFSDILEFSGMSEVDFASLVGMKQLPQAAAAQPAQQAQPAQPMQLNPQPVEA